VGNARRGKWSEDLTHCQRFPNSTFTGIRVQWFLNEEDPQTDPLKIARGLEGYAHQARLHALSTRCGRQSTEGYAHGGR
jgi:hypothetical protein